MSWASDILRALESGPMTTAQLREATGIRGANISSICNYLIRNGRIRRVDSQQPGRGYPATYAATGKPPPEKSLTKLRAENAALKAQLAARTNPHADLVEALRGAREFISDNFTRGSVGSRTVAGRQIDAIDKALSLYGGEK